MGLMAPSGRKPQSRCLPSLIGGSYVHCEVCLLRACCADIDVALIFFSWIKGSMYPHVVKVLLGAGSMKVHPTPAPLYDNQLMAAHF